MVIVYLLFYSGPLYSVWMKFLQQTEVFMRLPYNVLKSFMLLERAVIKTVRGKIPYVPMQVCDNNPDMSIINSIAHNESILSSEVHPGCKI